MIQAASLVAIVDDDPSVCRALRRLLASARIEAATFPSAAAFLASGRLPEAACLVLDIHLGGMSGFDLQEHLAAAGARLPIIFITAHDDLPTRERARRSGAVAYLRKPFDEAALLEAIAQAVGRRP